MPEPSAKQVERLRRHSDFVAVLKHRRTLRDRDIVVHILVHQKQGSREVCDSTPLNAAAEPGALSSSTGDDRYEAVHRRRLGLAVSKSVGNAVTRNRVKRQFRVLARRYEECLPNHCDIVMRAKPSAARAPFAQLEQQVVRLFGIAGAQQHREAT